jgi:hypothetical protein
LRIIILSSINPNGAAYRMTADGTAVELSSTMFADSEVAAWKEESICI